MKTISRQAIEKAATNRKPGYLEAVLAVATEKMVPRLFIEDAEWEQLHNEYALPPTPKHGPCANIGNPTGATVECPTCNGKVRLKLFACAAHGQCTTGKRVAGVACCVGCGEYAAAHKEGL